MLSTWRTLSVHPLSCISPTSWRLRSRLLSSVQSSCTSVSTGLRLHTSSTALSAGRCRASSATTFQLVFVADRQPHSTVYRRWPSFSTVAAARVWNSLTEHVTSAPSVADFRARLKTHLFRISYSTGLWLYSARAVTLVLCGHSIVVSVAYLLNRIF